MNRAGGRIGWGSDPDEEYIRGGTAVELLMALWAAAFLFILSLLTSTPAYVQVSRAHCLRQDGSITGGGVSASLVLHPRASDGSLRRCGMHEHPDFVPTALMRPRACTVLRLEPNRACQGSTALSMHLRGGRAATVVSSGEDEDTDERQEVSEMVDEVESSDVSAATAAKLAVAKATQSMQTRTKARGRRSVHETSSDGDSSDLSVGGGSDDEGSVSSSEKTSALALDSTAGTVDTGLADGDHRHLPRQSAGEGAGEWSDSQEMTFARGGTRNQVDGKKKSKTPLDSVSGARKTTTKKGRKALDVEREREEEAEREIEKAKVARKVPKYPWDKGWVGPDGQKGLGLLFFFLARSIALSLFLSLCLSLSLGRRIWVISLSLSLSLSFFLSLSLSLSLALARSLALSRSLTVPTHKRRS